MIYLDISEKFLADDGTLTKEIMPDSLHPNAKGNAVAADLAWAEMNPEPDTTAPSIDNVQSQSGSNWITVSWSTRDVAPA